MRGLIFLFLLHATSVRLHAIAYHQGFRNFGWWSANVWWRRPHQPSHPQVQGPLIVAPYVITVTKQQAFVETVTPTMTALTPTEAGISPGTAPTKTTGTSASPLTESIKSTDHIEATTEANTSSTTSTFRGNVTGSFANESAILEKCQKIRSITLRDACIRVAKNPLLSGVEGIRGYVGDEELNQRSFITARGLIVSQPSAPQVFCDEDATCPDLNKDRGSTRNLRSTSPWVICQEYDPNRFPQWLNTARCLCGGCIDIRTGRENGGAVVSQPLTVDITVIRKAFVNIKFSECNTRICKEEVQSIAIGCHCALADIRIASQDRS